MGHDQFLAGSSYGASYAVLVKKVGMLIAFEAQKAAQQHCLIPWVLVDEVDEAHGGEQACSGQQFICIRSALIYLPKRCQ